MTITVPLKNETITTDWQQPLRARGILQAAQKAGWTFHKITHQGEKHGGWQYPLYDLEGKVFANRNAKNNALRWKNIDSNRSPKYWWMGKKPEGSPDYYLMPTVPEAIKQAGGTVYIASGEPDVLTYVSAGIENVICWLSGEAAPPKTLAEDLHHLGVQRVVYFPDLDDTGRKSASKVAELLADTDINYVAYPLPEVLLGEKGDINRLWQHLNFDAEQFANTLRVIESCGMPLSVEKDVNAVRESQQVMTAEIEIDGKVKTITIPHGQQAEKDFPPGFYDALEKALSIRNYRTNGWSFPVHCPLKDHENDDNRPGGSWHGDKHIFHCFKCDVTLLAKDTGALLGINWRDYIDAKSGKGRDRSDEKTRYQLTNMGNVDRLIDQHGDRVRYVPSFRKWLVWNGTHWQIDQNENARMWGLVNETVLSMEEEARRERDTYRSAALMKHATRSQSYDSRTRILKDAQSREKLQANPSTLDADPMLLGCVNGAIDLKTGQLKRDTRGDLITKSAGVAFSAEAKAPRWSRFINEVSDGNADLARYIQKAVGYSLTGDVSEKCLFMVWGKVDNGKTLFLETLLSLFKDYGTAGSFQWFLKNRYSNTEANNGLAGLVGSRLVVSEEINRNQPLDEAIIKQVTGRNTITARFLYKEYFTYRPAFKLWLGSNFLPRINTDDPAIWRRLRVIPFRVSVPRHKQDPTLYQKLQMELPGILKWAVEGCLLWKDEGLGSPPAAAEEAMSRYVSQQDSVEMFVEETFLADDGAIFPMKKAYQIYREWCAESGEWQIGKKHFNKRLDQLGYERAHIASNRYGWKGLRLAEDEPILIVSKTVKNESDMQKVPDDNTAAFLETCEHGEDTRISIKALYEAYAGWCEDNSEEVPGKKTFNQRLRDLDYRQVHLGGNRFGWQGISIADGDNRNGGVTRMKDDHVCTFVNICRRDNSSVTSIKALYEAYAGWCEDNGEDMLGKKTFNQRLEEIGLKRTHMGGNRYGWQGIRL